MTVYPNDKPSDLIRRLENVIELVFGPRLFPYPPEDQYLPDDYGIEPAEDERLVHTGWACGFVGREAVTL